MISDDKRGTNWTDVEIERTVQAYFDYLETLWTNQNRPKSHIYKEISDEIGRSHKAVELKFQNISAVLDELGMEWIPGLAPRRNYQKCLADFIEERLVTSIKANRIDGISGFGELPQAEYVADVQPMDFVDVPPAVPPSPRPDYIERLVRKFDPSIRDFRNRQLGRAGEQYVLRSEIARLREAGKEKLAEKVDWIADSKGDGAGYDILSYDVTGKERFIEVKTTLGSKTTPFFMTRNEMDFSKEAGHYYSLVRLFNFRRNPRGFAMSDPIENSAIVTADSFRISF